MDKKYDGLFTFNIKQSYLLFTKHTKAHDNSWLIVELMWYNSLFLLIRQVIKSSESYRLSDRKIPISPSWRKQQGNVYDTVHMVQRTIWTYLGDSGFYMQHMFLWCECSIEIQKKLLELM